MKFHKFLITLLSLLLLFSVNVLKSQDEEAQQEEDMDEEQWEAQIADLTAKKNALTSQLDALQKEINDLTLVNNNRSEELKKTEDAYWNEFGGRTEFNSFKSSLESMEKACLSKIGDKEELMKKYEEMSKSRAKCHPDFFARFKKLGECLENWQSSIPEYTVLKGDYLFIIAAKKEVYNNKHMWPVIWEANENGVLSAPRGIPKTIRNPHIVYPGQVLKIPKLTATLKKSEIFERAKTWLDWKKSRKNRR